MFYPASIWLPLGEMKTHYLRLPANALWLTSYLTNNINPKIDFAIHSTMEGSANKHTTNSMKEIPTVDVNEAEML